MSTKFLIVGLWVLSFVFFACSRSEDDTLGKTNGSVEEMANAQPTADSSAISPIIAWNKYCPVSGGPVDAAVRTVSYDGKEWGFCCDGCDTKFENDPTTFAANISVDGMDYFGKKHVD